MNMRISLSIFMLSGAISGAAGAEESAAPIVSMKDFERIRTDMRIAAGEALDAEYPKFVKEDEFNSTSPGGTTIVGTYQWSSASYVLALQAKTREVRIPMLDLPFRDRLRGDAAVRSEYIDVDSTMRARRILEAAGFKIDSFTSNDPDAIAYLGAMADPAALAKIGARIMKGDRSNPPDPARAAIYFEAAAARGNADAQYVLGRFYQAGFPYPRVSGQSIRWLVAASDASHQEAMNVLNKMNVPENVRQKAREAHAEWTQKMEQQNKAMADQYLKAWEARVNKLIQPGGLADPVDIQNPRYRYLILKDTHGEYYYRDGQRLYL